MTPLESLFETDFNYIIKQTRSGKYPSKIPIQLPELERANDYRVTQALYPLILATKWLGLCPVQTKTKNKFDFQFKWISISFLASLFVFLFFGLTLFMWIVNIIFKIDGPLRVFSEIDQTDSWISDKVFKGSELIIVLNGLIKVSLPFGAWVQYALQWINLRSLCQYLNAWPRFVQEFESAFASYYSVDFNLKRWRNVVCFIWFLPIVILTATIKPLNSLEGMAYAFGIIASYFQVISVIGLRAVSYARDFLLLQTLIKAYDELLKGIKAQYGKCKKSITRDQVREWMDLITFVRKQTALIESYLSLHNLWSIFEVFISVLLILSMVVFLFMNNTLSETYGANFLPFALFSTSFFTFSLYWKAFLAEEISNKEEAIAEEIIEMETADDDCETRLEMKLICDLIYNDPTKIRVGNMLTLNKRLLLSFFSQLASYLVVILQFTKT